jgi:hypothetical protein
MATPATEGAASCAASATWVCGIIAHFSDSGQLFASAPILGFILISGIGGAVGWCLLLELGQFDDAHRCRVARSFATRTVIGALLGIIGYAAWSTSGDPNRGMWMLCSALMAAFPAEASQWAKTLFSKLIDVLGSIKR